MNTENGFSTSEDFEAIIENYSNGNKKDFVNQFDKIFDKSEFIEYVRDEYCNALLVTMMISYFKIKE